ncbi:uncharacterized protein LOC141909242 [Tubulanus polymorphus]|uniref:uncharacterized protein LOC141909242 n=1 Tax=Tubulanus polymorphus TaxID=672921 RepID=UPI003DA3D87C
MASKRFSKSSIFKLYQSAYKIKFQWDLILPPDVLDLLKLYDRAYNCNCDIAIPTLLTCIASIAGPNTRVSTKDAGFISPLNSYMMIVGDPGCGKSNCFERIIEPFSDYYTDANAGNNFILETYSVAGVQKHQALNTGYGLITSDEGGRLLKAINIKQKNGETERALLCKMWGGRGDTSTLSNGQRGFNKTSMSMNVMVQAEPLLMELVQLCRGDGFIDRFTFCVCKPELHQPEENVRAHREVMNSPLKNGFKSILQSVYEVHLNNKVTYTLSDESENLFNEIRKEYIDYLQRRYHENIEENQEQNGDIYVASSKDATHIFRLAALLHIFVEAMMHTIRRSDNRFTISEIIPMQQMQAAKTLFRTMQHQKAIFLEAVEHHNAVDSIHAPRVSSFPQKISKALLSSQGPVTSVRNIHRVVKSCLAEQVKGELLQLTERGFGRIYILGRSVFFMKPHPDTVQLPEYDDIFNSGIDIQHYSENFSKDCLPEFITHLPKHYQHELL